MILETRINSGKRQGNAITTLKVIIYGQLKNAYCDAGNGVRLNCYVCQVLNFRLKIA